jgi:hypothetical protein
MTDSDWNRLAPFSTLGEAAAAAAAAKLDGNIPFEILGPLDEPVTEDQMGACYLWVPAALVDEANFTLGEPTTSDEDLAKLALESSPPDDA